MRRALNLQLPPWPLALASGLTVVAALVWQSWDMPLNLRQLQQPAFREAVFDAPMAAAPGTGLPPELVSDETPVPNETPAAVAAETATPAAVMLHVAARSATVQAAAATGNVQPVATPTSAPEPSASVAGYQGPNGDEGVTPLVPGQTDPSPKASDRRRGTAASDDPQDRADREEDDEDEDDAPRGRRPLAGDGDTSLNSTTQDNARREAVTFAGQRASLNEATPTAQPAPQSDNSASLRGR
ncbi:MAG: hypothetical protein IT303_05205 [Dehalococcoidia bacterium]|nr:hypothetical protein [Dehalococcoidia bacterium]